jgi:alpha-L-rhamnosidase
MNSFNHYAYGAIGAWLYAAVGGIDLDPERPGYKHIFMRPRLGGELTYAKAELYSIYGLIRSAWRLKNGGFDWRIKIPAHTSATVYVPAWDGAVVREGGDFAHKAHGVSCLGREEDAEVYELLSGEYSFTVR